MKKNKILLASLLSVGIFYYFIVRYTDFGIPCIFYEIFHLKCPGCGITRMILQLSMFHWKEAMEANYFLFFTSPVLVGLCVYEWIRINRQRAKTSVLVNRITIGYLVLVLLWMLVRNVFHV